MKPHVVYAYGVVSSSTLYSIHGAFPSPEGYAEIDECRHMTGGEAANSSIVLSRLGMPVKLDGNWLGSDENGKRTKDFLSSYQIDTSRLPLKDGYRGVQEVVFSAAGTRTTQATQWSTACRIASTSADSSGPCSPSINNQSNPASAHTSAIAGVPNVTIVPNSVSPVTSRFLNSVFTRSLSLFVVNLSTAPL